MVISWSRYRQDSGRGCIPTFDSAWKQVEWTQRNWNAPCLLVSQPSHAMMAGELAAALLAESFGELPDEILQAVQMHDTGWGVHDAQQLHGLRSGTHSSGAIPISFVSVPAAEAAKAWVSSIELIQERSEAGAMVVSRHFTLLAIPNQLEHRQFCHRERERQRKLEGSASAGDLERWTAALGFCDLLSLYLLTGIDGKVEMTLAHPASPQARTAPRIVLHRDRHRLHFVPEIFQATEITLQALRHPVPAQGERAETLSWEIV